MPHAVPDRNSNTRTPGTSSPTIDAPLFSRHPATSSIQEFVHDVCGGNLNDDGNPIQTHVESCDRCRALARRYAMQLGASRGFEAVVPGVRSLDDECFELTRRLDTDGACIVRPAARYVFEMPDRPGIVRDITNLARIHGLSFTFMRAGSRKSASGHTTAHLTFEVDGGLAGLVEFERQWSRESESIQCQLAQPLPLGRRCSLRYLLSVEGQDQPNIVSELVDRLAISLTAELDSLVASTTPLAGALAESRSSLRRAFGTERRRFEVQIALRVRDTQHAEQVRRSIREWVGSKRTQAFSQLLDQRLFSWGRDAEVTESDLPSLQAEFISLDQ